MFTICSHFPYLNDSLSGFSFGFTSDGKPGYKEAGADAVVPFSKVIKVGQYTGNQTISLSSYAGYEYFTADDFWVDFVSCPFKGASSSSNVGCEADISGCSLSKSYDSTSGILSLKGLSQTLSYFKNSYGSRDDVTQYFTYNLYLVK